MSEIKGYYNGYDYMGYVDGKYMRFESEQAYYEFIAEKIKEEIEEA